MSFSWSNLWLSLSADSRGFILARGMDGMLGEGEAVDLEGGNWGFGV